MITALAITVAAVFAADTPPMISNGGFEQLQGERPARWDIFIAPYPQASVAPALPTARISREAHAGEYCAVLETPLPYPNEPFNNWSQNVIGRFGGQRLRVSGWIKTENADGASIWVQCWRRDPLRVAHVANTGELTPVFGTNDWQQVTLDFEVPEQTAFLTLRCVLKGGGKAWFDEVVLEPAPEPEPEAAPEVEPATAEAVEAPVVAEPERPAPPTPPVAEAPEASPAAENEPAAEEPATMMELPREDERPANADIVAIPDTAAIEAEIERLRAANEELSGALGSVQEDNRALLRQLATLQEQLLALQQALAPAQGEAPPAPAKEEAAAPTGAPPLVPRDYTGDRP